MADTSLFLLFLIPLALVFAALLYGTLRILRGRRLAKTQRSVLRNVNIVVAEDAYEKECLADESLVGRLSRMTSTNTRRSNTISSVAHVRHSRKESSPSDETHVTVHSTEKFPLSEIDEILLARGVLLQSRGSLYHSTSHGRKTSYYNTTRTLPRKPAAAATKETFRPGMERIALSDEPPMMRDLEAQRHADAGYDSAAEERQPAGEARTTAAEDVESTAAARPGGHAQRAVLPRDLSVIGEAGASESSTSAFALAAMASVPTALAASATTEEPATATGVVASPTSARSDPFRTPVASESSSPVEQRAKLPVVPTAAAATGGAGLVRKLSDVVRLRAPSRGRRNGDRSPSPLRGVAESKTPTEVFEITRTSREISAPRPIVAAPDDAPAKSHSVEEEQRSPGKPVRRSNDSRRRIGAGAIASRRESSEAKRTFRSPSNPPPFRPEEWSRHSMVDPATGEVRRGTPTTAAGPTATTGLQRAVSLSVPGASADMPAGLQRTPSIGVAGSRFKETFDDEDE